MDSNEFKKFRKRLNRTQKEIAPLLGVSQKAIHSYEQGWRNIPPHVERQMLFLLSKMDGNSKASRPCWVIKKCHPSIKVRCPSWEFNAGTLCWFINGNICCGEVCKDWKEKMKFCRSCKVLKSFL
jgi:hypothetical protein